MSEAQYHVSDALKDRYPYRDAPFRKTVDPDQVSRAFGSRSVPKYAELLRYPDLSDANRVRALQDLLDVLSTQEQKKVAVQHQMVESCTDLLCHPSSDIRRDAAKVLAALAMDRDARAKLPDLKTLDRLDQLLEVVNNGRVVQNAILAACKFSWFNDAMELIIERNLIIPRAIAILTSSEPPIHNTKTLDAAMEFLRNTTQLRAGAQRAVEYQIMQALPLVLAKFKDGMLPNTLLNGLFCCWNLAKEGQVSDSEMDIIPCLAEILSAATDQTTNEEADEIMRVCTGALMALSTNDRAKPYLVQYGVDVLCACLYSHNPSTKSNSIAAILNACAAANGLTRFSETILSDTSLVLEVFGPRVATVLNDKLLQQATVSDAITAAERLSRTPEGVDAIIQCLHMIDRIATVWSSKDANDVEIQVKAETCLRNISDRSETGKRRVARVLRPDQQDALSIR